MRRNPRAAAYIAGIRNASRAGRANGLGDPMGLVPEVCPYYRADYALAWRQARDAAREEVRRKDRLWIRRRLRDRP